MHWSVTLLTAAVLIGAATAMMLLEAARNRTSPPFPKSDAKQVTYWMAYLSFLVLGVTALFAAILH